MNAEKIQTLIKVLPDPQGAERFLTNLQEKSHFELKKLLKNEALVSDVLTIVSFSPLLSTTLLQSPKYIGWLKRQRTSAKVRGKDELLESLARFALTNSALKTNVLLARFRRRELLRIFLRDIRNLGTIAEITEEISNLADAVLEYALRIAQQELDNRYGTPFEIDEKNRAKRAEFCIVALGKLGSRELNYASDIDLLFLYSNNGSTSGQGTRGALTNLEYFVKLAEFITKLVGGQSGEGAAYRVDLRLRPNGRVGALAISLEESVNYYQTAARAWEKQVLIRSRAVAGRSEIFHSFLRQVSANVFPKDETIENALKNVRLSKEQINFEKSDARGFNVKLGRGGIREIEFIAQALQIAYGGRDEWLRSPHTLISLSRLADRKLLSETELTQLFEAYDFLRRLEHRLQMENGLQVHLIPFEADKCRLIAKKMEFSAAPEFRAEMVRHTENVSRVFRRIFGDDSMEPNIHNEVIKHQVLQIKSEENSGGDDSGHTRLKTGISESKAFARIITSLEKSHFKLELTDKVIGSLRNFCRITPNFAQMLASNPNLIEELPTREDTFIQRNYREILLSGVKQERDFAGQIAALRKNWARLLLEIVALDVFEKSGRIESKTLQTDLAEASIETAFFITERELERQFDKKIENLPLAILGLGKLGGGGMDYGSDLDLILVYEEREALLVENLTAAEFFSRAVNIFATTLSSLTRDGSLYRVDLRLRPDGKNGASATELDPFLLYLKNRSAIWEWLAYVKLRGVAGDISLAKKAEEEARRIIHRNALGIDPNDLRNETRRVRERLEQEKSSARKGKEIDIKFGEGGLLDVYFAVRFLQLRDQIPDTGLDRSTTNTLKKLFEKKSLESGDYQNFSEGYKFLTELDHNLRLTIGRSTLLPLANKNALKTIVWRMKIESVDQLLEKLTFHRLNIRASFDSLLGS